MFTIGSDVRQLIYKLSDITSIINFLFFREFFGKFKFDRTLLTSGLCRFVFDHDVHLNQSDFSSIVTREC